MLKKYLMPSIVLSCCCILTANPCLAEAQDQIFSSIKTINPLEQTTSASETNIDLNQPQSGIVSESKIINLNAKDTFYSASSATDKFVQCNVRASWEDFKNLINNAEQNDFVYISIANKMADLGLFDLADLASSKIKDNEITKPSTEDMKRFYYPKRKLKIEDELFLAENYSDILYNDQSSEATNELLKNEELLSTSDYANYLVALGSYKSNFFSRAQQHINLAIIQNPTNINYQKLKAEILAESKHPEEALKVVENLKKQNLNSFEYERKIKSLEQYVLYKTNTSEWKKNYHLGYYHYLENDSSKSIRALQTALASSKNKTNQAIIHSLMGEVYLSMNEFEKAAESAKKAYKTDRNNPTTLITLGDLSSKAKNYEQALKYYKQASNKDKNSDKSLLKEAETYQNLSNPKKAQEIYTKILKTHFDCYEAYYNVALLDGQDKEKEIIYIKKALAINPLFKDGWIELARIEITNGNYDVAKKYLTNAFYIDENDFRYYYYEGLVCKNQGDFSKAEYNFKKCLKLNASFKNAQKELEPVFNINNVREIK